MHIYHPLSHHYILIQVFGFLKNQRDIYNCVLVNIQWNTSATPFLYRAPQFTRFSLSSTKCLQTIKKAKEKQTFQPYHEMVREWNLKNLSVAYDIAECCPNLEKLGCNNGEIIGNRKDLLKNWTKLKTITLYNNSGTDLILETIKMHCNHLEEFILCNCPVTDIGLIEILKTFKGLKLLRLIQCNEISNQSLIIMSKHCNSLTNLDLRNCNRINDHGILALGSSSLLSRNLRSLYLESLNVSQHSLLFLAKNIMNLQELYLRVLNFINDEIVAAFNGHDKSYLKRLTLHLCPEIVGWGIKESVGIRELSLFMSNLKLQELDAICETCQLLEKFT